jgi:hypothetical protein
MALNIHCAVGGVNDTGELDQESVAGGFNYSSPKLGNLGVKKFTPARPKRRQSTFLVGTHQAAVTRNYPPRGWPLAVVRYAPPP